MLILYLNHFKCLIYRALFRHIHCLVKRNVRIYEGCHGKVGQTVTTVMGVQGRCHNGKLCRLNVKYWWYATKFLVMCLFWNTEITSCIVEAEVFKWSCWLARLDWMNTISPRALSTDWGTEAVGRMIEDTENCKQEMRQYQSWQQVVVGSHQLKCFL